MNDSFGFWLYREFMIGKLILRNRMLALWAWSIIVRFRTKRMFGKLFKGSKI